MKKTNQYGFTLIELLVVISVISLLSTILLASFSATRVSARDSARIQQVKQMDLAINLYKADHDGNVPNLASVSLGGCPASNTSNASNCVAKSSGNLAWSAFAIEMQPYMRNLPASSNGIDYVYMAPAAMGSGSSNSSYQISSDLEKTAGRVTGYTTGSALVSYPADGSTKYSVIFHTNPSLGDSTGCTLKLGSKVTNCNSTVSGLSNGSYNLTYLSGYVLPPRAAGFDVQFTPASPIIINSANVDVGVDFILYDEQFQP